MSAQDFISRYGGIYEHSNWVAEEAAALLVDGSNIDTIAMVMADCVDNACRDRQLALIRAHPDLAGKASIAAELTQESTAEQASAGLDQCAPREFERFQSLNSQYKAKFGFPFVMAVRESTREEILSAFEARLQNDYDKEFEKALAEIHDIARLRLDAMEGE